MTKLSKIVLTGAAGNLGGALRKSMSAICEKLVSTDIADGIDDLAGNESYANEIFARTPAIDPTDAVNMCHGGPSPSCRWARVALPRSSA